MAAYMDEDDDFVLADDFYQLLNVSKQASKEEITSAFRQASKLYHPDKHVNPAKKKDAEVMFNKIKRAYEVLSDPNKRDIYNRVGLKGLEIEGLELVTRTKSPAEIIAELDRYREEQEKRKLEQRTNPRGNVSVGINATELFDRYRGYGDEDEYEVEGGSITDVEINSISLSQSVECPLTRTETASIAVGLSSQNGRGQGSVTVMCRTTKLMNNTGWAETDITFGNGVGLGGKIFRQINKRCYCVCGVALVNYGNVIMVYPSLSLTYQLSRYIQMRMTCCPIGMPVFIRTSLIYDSQQNHASVAIQLGLQSSYIQAAYLRKNSEEESKLRVAAKYGTAGAILECGCEKKISQFSWLGATMVLGVPIGVMLRIKLVRGQQTFTVPIHLSEQILPNAVFYGSVLPALFYTVTKKLIVDPYLRKQEEENLEKKKEEHSERLAEKKKQAETVIDLMKETVERIRETEEKKKGLLIVKALYGKLTSNAGELQSSSCIEVTIPLQALVKDSKLILHNEKTKSEIPGFYDPCPGELKSLYIRYRFRDMLHQVTLSDKEAIRIPKQDHVIQDELQSTDLKT